MNKKILILIIFFLASCQAAKDGLTGKKRTNADEFLVEKKNPLVLPPNYGKLPSPDNQEAQNKKTKSNEIQELFKNENFSENSQANENINITNDIEKSILEKIKK
tara:strand:+ start:263 stop:577 length:315 start_codon:yes stop_codon:yes gene_type:complete